MKSIFGKLADKFRGSSTEILPGKLKVKIVRKVAECTDICTFELADPAGGTLPGFSAGSHIDVYMRRGLVRQYSLCNDPRETHRYLIGVLRDPKSRGGSRTMHDEIEEGDLIEISAPKNHFALAHSVQQRSLLFAGGIGVTPILCMAERLSNVGADFEMHYCSRSVDRTAFVDRIRNSEYSDHVHFHFDDGAEEQRLNLPPLLSFPSQDSHLYVCGPTGFMEYVIKAALTMGWSDENVHREYFAAVPQDSINDSAFQVKIASSGKVFQVPVGKSIATVLAESGVQIPVSCEQGVCGTCVTRIIDGEPEHRDTFLSKQERAKNDQFTPCCSRAKSSMLVLDL
ncbi:PDR/VanB family oxidoreductase [Paraburkholderia sp.]|uniref:PDR/VanB family oxidoreductase n=1 Tax=Paraburkholderia sp. TaxID=1926495 RepID=UPI00238D4B84|nr:PDR/VanB family oxidoreductase [Paraburkholderia sp.]MDE1182597.1 PDR/VanB family oxidoreductase [Paraburkholderia sp.]